VRVDLVAVAQHDRTTGYRGFHALWTAEHVTRVLELCRFTEPVEAAGNANAHHFSVLGKRSPQVFGRRGRRTVDNRGQSGCGRPHTPVAAAAAAVVPLWLCLRMVLCSCGCGTMHTTTANDRGPLNSITNDWMNRSVVYITSNWPYAGPCSPTGQPANGSHSGRFSGTFSNNSRTCGRPVATVRAPSA